MIGSQNRYESNHSCHLLAFNYKGEYSETENVDLDG